MNWLDRARREIRKSASQATANSAERNLTALLAVPNPPIFQEVAASNGSIGSACQEEFEEHGPYPKIYQRFLH